MKKNLQRILSNKFSITPEDIARAQETKKEKNISFTEALLDEEIVSEEILLKALSKQFEIPYQQKLATDNIDISFTSIVPIHFLRKFTMVPVFLSIKDEETEEAKIDMKTSYFAINNPMLFQEIDDVLDLLRKKGFIFPKNSIVLSSREEINSLVNFAYDRGRGSAQNLVEDMSEEKSVDILDEIEQTADLLDDSNDAPIIKLVNHMISQSVKARASDIHIEPSQESFKVRYRIDGILYDLLTPPKWIQSALISRIKIMANLDIAEKRLPQDGRIEVKIGSQMIDIRVSSLPTTFGERVVMRLLDKQTSLIPLKQFGFTQQRLEIVERLIKAPNGIILVTGPTGSGKTTTLYAILQAINSPEINIITIEDPVEYQISGIGQIQVNSKIDLTFAKGLRSIVRQDPDVILVGEIRDNETAEIAVQSALTGHLVFSTLHTNDAPSAITRLVDIGIEPFLLSSSINAVIAQRLLRVLCNNCKKEYTPRDQALQNIGLNKEQVKDTKFYKAVGCSKCFNTGYKGRTVIFEIMELNENLKEVILKTTDAITIKQKALEFGVMSTLRYDGVLKIIQGITTIEEVLRVTNL